ncbi:hypothetical protein C8R45DRAFT_1070215 [Mycena sanguinolenta]|nr:hypothetical protein C8R45DRAFT_1070215 [Mycena sanguinolenta]
MVYLSTQYLVLGMLKGFLQVYAEGYGHDRACAGSMHVNPLVAGRDFFRVPELSSLFVFVNWNQVLSFPALSVTAFPQDKLRNEQVSSTCGARRFQLRFKQFACLVFIRPRLLQASIALDSLAALTAARKPANYSLKSKVHSPSIFLVLDSKLVRFIYILTSMLLLATTRRSPHTLCAIQKQREIVLLLRAKAIKFAEFYLAIPFSEKLLGVSPECRTRSGY